MIKAKYKEGDAVRIRKDLSLDMIVPFGVNDQMIKYAGKKAKITDVTFNYLTQCFRYRIDLDGKEWAWSESMFIQENECVVIYHKDNKVIAINKRTKKTAEVKCSPEDNFDFEIGAKLAIKKLFQNFKVGDRVIGKVEASDRYRITGEGCKGRVIEVNLEDEKQDIKIETQEGCTFWVNSKYFDLYDSSKYFTGEVVCTKSKSINLTKGKIYKFVNGYSKFNDGTIIPRGDGITSINDLNDRFASDFIEVVK